MQKENYFVDLGESITASKEIGSVEVKVKLLLCLIKHCTVKACEAEKICIFYFGARLRSQLGLTSQLPFPQTFWTISGEKIRGAFKF